MIRLAMLSSKKNVNIFLPISFNSRFWSHCDGSFEYPQHMFWMRNNIKNIFTLLSTGPRSAVGNVSGYRCVSDCRSRGREFDPGPVPYFRGD